MRRLFSRLDYQWAVNREMGVMAAGASIPKAIAKNTQTFEKFSQTILKTGA
jgi:hypothetical protein